MGKLVSPGTCVIVYDENGNLVGSDCKSYGFTPDETSPPPPIEPPTSISTGNVAGRIINDLDGNGVEDPTDSGFFGITVQLTDSNGDVFTVMTDIDGNYLFLNVRVGTTEIFVDPAQLPPGTTPTINTNPHTFTVFNGMTASPINIGFNVPPQVGGIRGRIIDDLDGNGIIDPTDQIYSGVEVTLVDINGDTHLTTTDINGFYEFQNLPVGMATVSVDLSQLPNGAISTNATYPVQQEIFYNTIVQPVDLLFYVPIGSLTVHIYDDVNNNGTEDAGDGVHSGISIAVTDQYNSVYNLSADGNGDAIFNNIPIGQVSISIDETGLPPNTVITEGNNPETSTIVDASMTVVDIGYHTAQVQQPFTITIQPDLTGYTPG